MVRDVIIGISGLQYTDKDNADCTEMIASGQYYFRNGKHYITYDEVLEGYEDVSTNTIKISPTRMEVKKKGLTDVTMVFDRSEKHLSNYATPMGNLLMGINTENIHLEEEEDRIYVEASYVLSFNYEVIANCIIKIKIRPRAEGNFTFEEL